MAFKYTLPRYRPQSLWLAGYRFRIILAMRFAGPGIAVILVFLMMGCSSESQRQNFDYLRTASNFTVDTVAAADKACDQEQKHFASPEECRNTKKFMLRWERPEEADGLSSYRIYLDTLPPDAPDGRDWRYVQSRPELAAIIVMDVSRRSDSLIFFLTDKSQGQDTLSADRRPIMALDTTGRASGDDGRYVFALVTEYTEGRGKGLWRDTYLISDDKFPPLPFSPQIKVFARELHLQWRRPTDPTSLFNPSADRGLIKHYRLQISAANAIRTNAFGGLNDLQVKSYRVGGVERSGETSQSTDLQEETTGKILRTSLTLPDSNSAILQTGTEALDSISLEIEGLHPLDTIRIQLEAVDSSGNTNIRSMQQITLILTDTTQPSTPKLSVLDSARNRLVVQWTASRDSLTGSNGNLIEGGNPNANIAEYRFSLISQARTVEKIRRVTSVNRDSAVFIDTLKFLPPGTPYLLRVYAIDSSGHESRIDSLRTSTLPVIFGDTALTCPDGYVKMPSRTFTLGQTGSTQRDESPREVTNEPFCIEEYEHRDSAGFVYGVTWEEAYSACDDLNASLGGDSLRFQLCSEAQWERACEGADSEAPHEYGVQGDPISPALLQNSCNQGTNDSVMAKTLGLRDGACLSNEGVYDLAGNYSEWVLDEYDSTGYAHLANPGAHPDSPPMRPDELHVFRGGNYLRPNIPAAERQKLARCANRDFPHQVRPQYRESCRSVENPDRPKIVVVFDENRLSGHFCRDIPSELQGKTLREIIPNPKDTVTGITQLFLFYLDGNEEKRHTFDITHGKDEPFGNRRPLRAVLTSRSLMEVFFVKPGTDLRIADTLDARSLKDTANQSALDAFFGRESGNSWEVEKNEAGAYNINYLYGFPVTGTKPAKRFFSSRAIGFRCCSLPIRETSPPDSVPSPSEP